MAFERVESEPCQTSECSGPLRFESIEVRMETGALPTEDAVAALWDGGETSVRRIIPVPPAQITFLPEYTARNSSSSLARKRLMIRAVSYRN